MKDAALINNELTRSIQNAWSDLENFMSGLTEYQMNVPQDAKGWNVKDHLAHIWIWENVLFMLFNDQIIDISLNIPMDKYTKMDDVNEDIKNQWAEHSLEIILDTLHNTHEKLMKEIASLTEEELQLPTVKFFAKIYPQDKRTVSAFIRAHTDEHYPEHLEWMEVLSNSAI